MHSQELPFFDNNVNSLPEVKDRASSSAVYLGFSCAAIFGGGAIIRPVSPVIPLGYWVKLFV